MKKFVQLIFISTIFPFLISAKADFYNKGKSSLSNTSNKKFACGQWLVVQNQTNNITITREQMSTSTTYDNFYNTIYPGGSGQMLGSNLGMPAGTTVTITFNNIYLYRVTVLDRSSMAVISSFRAGIASIEFYFNIKEFHCQGIIVQIQPN